MVPTKINQVCLFAIIFVVLNASAYSAPIIFDSVHVFRDFRGPSSVRSVGDRIIWVAHVNPAPPAPPIEDFPASPSDQVFLDNTVVTVSQIGGPLEGPLNPNFSFTHPTEFTAATTYEPNLTSIAWTFVAMNEGDSVEDTVEAIGAVERLPLVTDATLDGSGLVKWTIPQTNVPHTNMGIQIIRDSDDVSVFVTNLLPPDTTEFVLRNNPQFPELDTILEEGEAYAVRITMRQREDGRLLNRSSTFLNFTPLPPSTGTVVIPTIDADGVSNFDVAVTQSSPIVLSTIVESGFEYQLGAGNPLIESIKILTDIGDGLYDLFLFDGVDFVFEQQLAVGELLTFAQPISRFQIGGILDTQPLAATVFLNQALDATAFLTEVTFNGSGRFTGSMTPVATAEPPNPAPAPGTFFLMSFGIAGIGYRMQTQKKKKSDSVLKKEQGRPA